MTTHGEQSDLQKRLRSPRTIPRGSYGEIFPAPSTTMGEDDATTQRRPIQYEPVADPIPSDVHPFTAPSSHPFEIPILNVTASSVPLPKAAPLEFPNDAPPGHETHYNGCWKLDGLTRRKVWVRYQTGPLNYYQLPANVPHTRSHWVNRVFPDGHFLTDHLEWIPSDIGRRNSMPYRSHGTPYSRSGLTPSTYQTPTTQGTYRPTRWNLPKLQRPVTLPPGSAVANPTPGYGGAPGGDYQPSPRRGRPGFDDYDPGDPYFTKGGDYPDPEDNGPGKGRDSPPLGPRRWWFHDDGGDGGGGFDPDGEDWYGRPGPGEKAWFAKISADDYKPLKSNAQFNTWSRGWENTLAAHDMLVAVDNTYRPTSRIEAGNIHRKRSWLYMVLAEKVQTSNGKEIILRHKGDKDIAAILAELEADAHQTPSGLYQIDLIIAYLSTARYNPNRDGKSEECCVAFNLKMDDHDEHCNFPGDKLLPRQRRRYLRGYFSEVTAIARVWTDEVARMATNNPELTYEQLYQVVRHACATYDQARDTSRRRQRSANVHSLGDLDSGSDDGETDEPDSTTGSYEAFLAAQANAPRLPDEPWQKLSREGRAAWYQLPESVRSTLVEFMQVAKPQETRRVNMASIEEVDEANDEDQVEESTLQVNQAAAKPAAKSPPQSKVNAEHAGDIRRVLSSRGKPAKATREANVVKFDNSNSYSAFTVKRSPAEAAARDYWANTTQVSYRGEAKEPSTDAEQDFRRGDR